MEALSKVHWSVPLFIFIPLILFFFYLVIFTTQAAWWFILLWYAIGLLVWTITEYLLHRFVFHYHPKTTVGKRVFWIFHGVHHDYPNDKMRLVMPPSVSLPLGTVFFFLFRWIFSYTAQPLEHLYAFFPGFLTGYLIYDMTHYALHHLNAQPNWIKRMKKHHMIHHYQEPERGFGVSSALWDNIFGSNFSKRK
jgi:sterol desaturase/sphingolipid hydroxylase (fatty acid hydroxylase superfamily)